MNEPRPTHTVEESMIWRNGRNNGIHEERGRIVIILQDNIADEDLYRTLIAAINGDDK